MEHHPADGHLGLERVEQVPGDGLALAVGVGGEQHLVDRLQRVLELGDLPLLLRRDDVEGGEGVVDVDAEARPRLALVLGRDVGGAPRAGRGCARPRPRRRSPCRGTSGSWRPSCRTRRSPGVAVGRPPSWPRACGGGRPRRLPRRFSSSSFRLSRAVLLHRLRVALPSMRVRGMVRTLGVTMVTVRARIPVCRESVTTSVKALGLSTPCDRDNAATYAGGHSAGGGPTSSTKRATRLVPLMRRAPPTRAGGSPARVVAATSAWWVWGACGSSPSR